MECFDPHTNKWSMCAPMSKRRGGVGVATYNNFLYAVGGHDAPASNNCSRLSDCVERYARAPQASVRTLTLTSTYNKQVGWVSVWKQEPGLAVAAFQNESEHHRDSQSKRS